MVTHYCRKVATTENLTFDASMRKNIFLTFSIFQKGIKKTKYWYDIDLPTVIIL